MLEGGENLLEVVDKLAAEAAAQEAALQAQKAAEESALSRIAELEEEHMLIEEQYSSVQVTSVSAHFLRIAVCCGLPSLDGTLSEANDSE